MTEMQAGILQWLAAVLIFLLGVGFGRWIERGRRTERRVLSMERERLRRLERGTVSRARGN